MQFRFRQLLILFALILVQITATAAAVYWSEPAFEAASDYVIQGMHRAIFKGCCGFTLS